MIPCHKRVGTAGRSHALIGLVLLSSAAAASRLLAAIHCAPGAAGGCSALDMKDSRTPAAARMGGWLRLAR